MDDERNHILPGKPTAPQGPPTTRAAANTTLDDLADLFLTGTTGPAPVIPPKAMPAARDPLAGPAPFKLAPKPAQRRVGGELGEDRADTARLAGRSAERNEKPALRFTGAVVEDVDEMDSRPERDVLLPAPSPRLEPPMVEAVLLGNLPGLAGAWLTQYAQLLAQQDGPVAVLYLDPVGDAGDGRVDMELVEPSIQSAATGSAVRLAPAGPTRLRDTLEALCRSDAQPVRTVLVHADAEPAVFELLADVPAWTLLTGADPMAVSAARATFERLLEGCGPVPPTLGVVVMGAEGSAALSVAESLSESLSVVVTCVGFQKRLMPVAVRSVGAFAGLSAQWGHLSAWLADHSVSVEEPTVEAVAVPSETKVEPLPEVVVPQPVAMPPRVRPSPRLNRAMPVKEVVAETGPTRPGSLGGSEALKEAVVPASVAPVVDFAEAAAEPDLLGLLSSTPAAIEGATVLQARCPAQPETMLVLDAVGRLHLLAVHQAAGDHARSAGEAMLRLTDAAQWAREHRDLLALTLHGRSIDRASLPALHLFTDRADLAVPLLAKPGPALNLHLLQRVRVGEVATWFCTPLQRAV